MNRGSSVGWRSSWPCSSVATEAPCVGRDDGTTASVYVQNDQQALADYTAGTVAGRPTYNDVFASFIDEPVVRDGSGGLRYYHRNQQYSITALTNASGTIVERYAFTAYGKPTLADGSGTIISASAEGNRYTYTGREWDDGLSLYHYRARMCDGVSGRFLSRDPIGFRGSSWNLYEYVSGRAPSAIDPSGLEWYQPPYNDGPPIWIPDPPPKPPAPKPGPNMPNKKHLIGTNICCFPPSKSDRESPIPGVTTIPIGGYPVGPTGGSNTTYPYPATPPANIGGGGAFPCIVAVVKCGSTVTVFHFSPGDDPGSTLFGNSWNGCTAIVCGGSDEYQSNCLAKEVVNGFDNAGIPIAGVSSSDSCGVISDGGWYQSE